MFMSAVRLESGTQMFADLAGARVLITGITPKAGVDVARAFAEHKTRLIVQSPETSPEMTELAVVLAGTAAEIHMFNDPLLLGEDAVRLTQSAAKLLGGIDAVVNIASVSSQDLAPIRSYEDVEALVSAKLLGPTLITRVAANRMRLMLTEGSILNVVSMAAPLNERESALTGLIRAALAALTRGEAQQCAQDAIRINAIGPRGAAGDTTPGAVLNSEPDIASLALHLASKKGRQLSGYVFDAQNTQAYPV